MYPLIGIKTDHSLLKSLIKIDDLIVYLKENEISICGICDDNLFSAMEFYLKCQKNDIKPIIGLDIIIENKHIYLYAKNYNGYQNLLQINTLMQQQELSINTLEKYSRNIICIIPYENSKLYKIINNIYEDVLIGYQNEYEKNNALLITKNLIFFNIIKTLNMKDLTYLKYLDMIATNTNINNYEKKDYSKNYILEEYSEEDKETILDFASKIRIEIPQDKFYIPKYKNLDNSLEFLDSLAHKGLLKRLNYQNQENYVKRLEYELDVIKSMGFADYFLIVYDYILYAKKNNILVGPGRGSAAGSLVAYSLGITDIDPLKYDLLFERFLNKQRITMPDIDVDFEDLKRGEIIKYLKETYNSENVANIMTYSSLTSKQVLKDVAKIINIEEKRISSFLKLIDAKLSLLQNYQNPQVKEILKNNKVLQSLYKIALKLEGLKRQISTHAAGVVISSEKLDNLIPIVYNNDNILTGCTMEYLESLGLIKMDVLSIRNLRTIHEVLDLIEKTTNQKIKLNDIPLDDEKTLELFKTGNTVGIFQFESEGMKNFLKKLKPSSFEDLIAAIALFRPGPMENIDEFIKRKEKKVKVEYPHPDLESILKSTYGIIVYQEQIMQILVKMGGYSFYEADNIRRAMSKKKKDIMEKERSIFLEKSLKNGYNQETASKVYDLIVKFANYGFNKSHSVAYALVGYQMAYLKAHYEAIFYANMLNMSISSEVKTNEYLQVIKQRGIKILSPSINKSTNVYQIKNNYLLLPLGVIRNVGTTATLEILEERKKGKYQDFFDFVKRTHGKSVTKKVIESLIYAGVFKEFKYNKRTLIEHLDDVLDYAGLNFNENLSLSLAPTLEEKEEYSMYTLIKKEKEVLGFFITNHPASFYNKNNIMKLENIKTYFDQFVKCVVLVTKIFMVETKKGEKMYFVTAEDETRIGDFVIFPRKNALMSKFKRNDLILVTGKVEKRKNDYQIVVSNIEKIK